MYNICLTTPYLGTSRSKLVDRAAAAIWCGLQHGKGARVRDFVASQAGAISRSAAVVDHETVRAAYAVVQPKLNLNLYDIDLPLFCPFLPFPFFFLALLFLTLFEANPGHGTREKPLPSSIAQLFSSRVEPSRAELPVVCPCQKVRQFRAAGCSPTDGLNTCH